MTLPLRSRPSVVLVCGAFGDAASWSDFVPLLEDRGLSVIPAQCPLTSFAANVAAAWSVVEMLDRDVLLVGHSWDGAVITDACGHPRVRGAVYIASGPDSQQSLGEWLKEIPVVGEALAPGDTPAAGTAWAWKSKPAWFVYGEQGDHAGPDEAPMPAELAEVADVVAQAAAELAGRGRSRVGLPASNVPGSTEAPMRLRRVLSAAGAVIVSGALLAVMGFGVGGIPALGPALDPGRGAWTSAYGGTPVTSQALRVPGLDGPVTVSFTSAGLASITAGDSRDMFLALGYVHARHRLAEMDLERRLGEGRLAELAGPSDTSSDEFELRLGLLRTAQNQWARTTGPARAALLAYAQGVNDDIAQVRASGDWPALYSLAGVYPRPWTPVDSLVVQGVLTQELDYTTGPLDYAILQRSLGATNTMAWFPVLPANSWTPYDPGPYVTTPLTPVAPDVASSAVLGGDPQTPGATPDGSAEVTGVRVSGRGGPGRSDNSSGDLAQAAGALLGELSQLRPGQVHRYPDSNAWAVNGPAVSGGGTLLGGDPHLPQTLPSVWYEVALSAPGYQVAGATVPGVPGVLLGHNAHIAWSLTDTQNEATLYYAETVRGDEYFWRGAWHPMTVEHYTIPVRGSSPVSLAVDITVHGPIMTSAGPLYGGQTMAVDWMGNVPSDDLASLIGINQASDWAQFKAALSTWRAPTQNFTYADNDPVSAGSGSASGGSGGSSPRASTVGNIGVYAAGYYPQVPAGCQPWLPMSGTGACDIDGVIPYSAIPQAYDPPSHVIATDNQRPVSASYPYYVGTSGDFYDPGYRAGYAYQSLDAAVGSGQASATTIASLQNSVTDSLAASIVPRLLAVLRSAGPLPPAERSAASVLGPWDYSMSAGSAAATVWWTFWSDYVGEVFEPWWKAGHVPAGKDPTGLKAGPGLASLDEDLQAWTLAAPGVTAVADATFRGPSGHGPADARAAMLAAFRQAASGLSATLGGAASSWAWGRVHARAFPSVTGAAGLGYGPRATGGDPFVEDAADGGMTASTGPSWRMVATLSGPSGGGSSGGAPGGRAPGGGVAAEGVYPGGQSENPASPWYDNLVSLWWDGQYLPVPEPGSAGFAGGVRWALHG